MYNPNLLHIQISDRFKITVFATGGCQKIGFDFSLFSGQHPHTILELDRRYTGRGWGGIGVHQLGFNTNGAFPSTERVNVLLKIIQMLLTQFAHKSVFDRLGDQEWLKQEVKTQLQEVLPLLTEYEDT